MAKKVLYIGRFQLPDKNAAAHRVLSIAKSLRDLSYEVVFFGVGEISNTKEAMYADGFKYYNVFTTQKGEHFKEMIHIEHIKNYVCTNPEVKLIIAYNYPSFALARIALFCKKKGVLLVADCTEWYNGTGGSFLSSLLKQADTAIRMRIVQKHIDGVISISSYLYDYYKKHVLSIKIPPTVDLNSTKYKNLVKEHLYKKNVISIVYCGSPSASKESLGQVVTCINKLYTKNIQLCVVGVTEEQFVRIYSVEPNAEKIKFLGRVEHQKALETVFNSDYALIVRPNSRLTRAGFPTKFVEAISCGTPIIATDTSDLSEYLSYGQNGYMIPVEQLNDLLDKISAGMPAPQVERDLFDYRNYTGTLACFLEKLGVK